MQSQYNAKLYARTLMSEKELNSYRLTSLEEPSDEMLSQIMKEVAWQVKEENACADYQFMSQLKQAAKAV